MKVRDAAAQHTCRPTCSFSPGELVTVLVAGHETTATDLAWAIERLVRHPPPYERLREDDEYALAVAYETLRLSLMRPCAGGRSSRSSTGGSSSR